MDGWISIHRKIKDHWVWSEKPFSKGQAWIDLLMMVNHEDKKILLGNELIEIKRGSRTTSIRKLCERWGWSNTKIKNYLNLLEKDKMLVVKSDSKKTTITILNYNDYQGSSDSKNDSKTSRERQASDSKTSREHTNNNDNNDNNDNKENNKGRKKISSKNVIYDEDEEVNQAILDFIDFRKKIRATMTDRAITLMVNKLNKMTNDNDEKIEILEQSIMNGWKSVYPLKEDSKDKANNKFNDFPQRERTKEDYKELERKLLNKGSEK